MQEKTKTDVDEKKVEIQAVVIHEIIKDINKTSATSNCSNELVDVNNDNVSRIIKALDASFGKKALRRAKFSEDGFRESITDFSNYDLLEISKKLTIKLKDKIEGIQSAKGGYLIFAKIKNKHDFLAVFLVRDVDGTKLKLSNGKCVFESTLVLDINHLAMGAKINISLLNSESDDRYISLVKGNTDISKYFENWIGVDDTKQENKNADMLYKLSNNIELPKGCGTREEFKVKIHGYVNNNVNKSVNLREMSLYFYEDEDVIPNFCEENDYDIDSEFSLSKNNLKKFLLLKVKVNDIELTAQFKSFRNDLIEVKEDVVLIHSSEFAKAITKRLKDDE